MFEIFEKRTDDCVKIRQLGFHASLLGVATEIFLESAGRQIASDETKRRVHALTESESSSSNLILLEDLSDESKDNMVQLSVQFADALHSKLSSARNGKLGQSLQESVRKATVTMQRAVASVVRETCYATSSGELSIIDSYVKLDADVSDMQQKLVSDIVQCTSAALDAFDGVLQDVGSVTKVGLGYATQAQALVVKIRTVVIPAIRAAFPQFPIVITVIDFLGETGIRILMSVLKLSKSHAVSVIEILTQVISIEMRIYNTVDPVWLRGLGIADSILSIVNNAIKLFVKGNRLLKESMTYITETVNTLVSMVQVAHNWYAAKHQMKMNRALVSQGENLAETYHSKKSWSTCRALISIDDAAKAQGNLLRDFAKFVSERHVEEIESSVLASSLEIVFDKVCPGFALGCSRVLDSPELPLEIRNAVTEEMRKKIRDRVMYGPISDIAVAMNAEQGAKLMSIGFRRAGEYLFICRSCTPNAIAFLGLLGRGNEPLTRQDVMNYVDENIMKSKRGSSTNVKGVAINIQFLRRVFGKGRVPLAFVQLPLSELSKIPEQRILVNIMSDFEQLPRHQTTYDRFLWVKYNQAKENFQDNERFANLYKSIGYDFIGQGMVESHDIIKAFDGQCPDDAEEAEVCEEWPYYWALGALFGAQKEDKWDGNYVTPSAMKYRDIPAFDRLILTRGWACRFNEKLLQRGKIVQSSPTCFGAAKTGEQRTHPRWDLWSMSGSVSSSDVSMDPSKVRGEALYKESDCVIAFAAYEKNAKTNAWLSQMEQIYAASVNAYSISSNNEFLSAYVENLVTGQGRCDSKLQIGPTYMNDRIENSNVRLYRNVEVAEVPDEETRQEIAGVSFSNIEKMVCSLLNKNPNTVFYLNTCITHTHITTGSGCKRTI